MVNGLKFFQEAFETYADQYILIGGTACDLLLDNAGLPFRATRDLDIVLCIEALEESFVRRFWQFVDEGGYEIKEKAQNHARCLYRFSQPALSSYPSVLELFSRRLVASFSAWIDRIKGKSLAGFVGTQAKRRTGRRGRYSET